MNMMMRLTAVTAVLAGTSLIAQESVGTILGTVRSDKGVALAGVSVRVSSPALLGARIATSDDKGNFRIPLLMPGEYQLSATSSGFVGGTVIFRVSGGLTQRQDLTLREVAIAGTVVEVVAMTAAVDKTETKTATVISSAVLQTLPVSVYAPSAQFLSPGVSGSSDFPSIRGSVGGASQYTINGVSVRDGVLRYGRQTAYNIADLTEEIQVMTSALNAKYGNASGGLINLVTKSGTNEFTGSFRVSLNRDSWGSFNAPYTYRRFNSSVSYTTGANANLPPNLYLAGSNTGLDDLNRSYQLTVLGPIIKDKLTFSYGRTWAPSYTTTAALTNVLLATVGYTVMNLVNNPPPPGTPTTAVPGYRWGVTNAAQSRVISGVAGKDLVQQAKLFWQVNPNHQVEVFYTQDDFGPNFDNQYLNIDDVSDRRQTSTRTLGGVTYRGMIQGGALEVRIGQTKKEITWPSGPGEPIYVRSWQPVATSILSSYSGRSAQYLTNGDPGSPIPELRQNNNISANYFLPVGEHNIDVGLEQLKETALLYESAGANRRRFYSPGMDPSGNYAVFNWGSSTLANPVTLPTTSGAYTSIVNSAGAGFVPEMLTYADGGGGDPHNVETTNALYVNDQWAINGTWSVMGGLRYDNWQVKDRMGTEINTKGISPRVEVKYDLNADGRKLLSLSYAHLRGTIGQGNLGTYARRPGNAQTRYFWNEGAGTMHFVPQATLLNPANYSLFTTLDSDTGKAINPDLRPEMTKQIELTYRQSFPAGGFFRTSLVYRKVVDLWYRRGINELAVSGSTISIQNMLDFDPYQNRNYQGVEVEWILPLLRSGVSAVDLNGFWTTARSRGRVTWSDGGAATAIRFDDIYQANGYSIDNYNSYGEMAAGNHNNFKLWLTWIYGKPSGIQSSVTLLYNYQTGAPYSNSYSEYLPGFATGDTRPLILQYTKDTPTSLAYFLSQRGAFTAPDTYYLDLKWNVTIPVAKKVKFFTELTIGNILNQRLATSYTRDADAAVRSTAIPAAIDRTYTIDPTVASYSRYGLVGTTGLGRIYSIDCGIRF